MNLEEKILELEKKLSTIENALEKTKKGHFKEISVERVNIRLKSHNEDVNPGENCGLFIYSKDNQLIYKVSGKFSGDSVRTTYYSNNGDSNLELGLCEHGAGRINLNNTDGNSMIYLGTISGSDNHSPIVKIQSQDDMSGIEMVARDPESESNLGWINYIEIYECHEGKTERLKNVIRLGSFNKDKNCASIQLINTDDEEVFGWQKTSHDKF